MKSDAPTRFSMTAGELAALVSAGLFYVALRLLGWLNSPELEGHDSVRYLEWAQVFTSGDWHAIVNLSPDAAPLLPLLTALFSFLPGDIETAARLLAMLSSIATLVAVYLIGRRIGDHLSAVTAVFLLAVVSPDFFRMSYATLSEPLYIALFSWVALVFIWTVDKPGLGSGIVLGILSSLAFLTRVEGILLIAALPVLHLMYAWIGRQELSLRSVAAPNLLLVLVMAAIAAPQVLRVSVLMNSFVLNGRSVWPVMLANPDGKSYNEKLTGLDFDPGILNLHYLQTQPEALEHIAQSLGHATLLKSYARTVVHNLKVVHNRQLVPLVGLPVLAFSIVGFLAMLKAGRGARALLPAAFMAIALAGPLVYEVSLRHLLILVPFLCVYAARGITETADVIASDLFGRRQQQKAALAVLLLIVTVIPAEKLAKHILRPDDVNGEYSEESLREPVLIVRQFSEASGRPASIMMRKTYLAFFSGSRSHITPYTDLRGLLTYMDGRKVDFLFVEERHLEDYPFVDEIGSRLWQAHFREVYSSDEYGQRQVLYAFQD